MHNAVRKNYRALRFKAVLLPTGSSLRSLARSSFQSQIVGMGWEPSGQERGYHWAEVRGKASLPAQSLTVGQVCGIGQAGLVGYAALSENACCTEARFWLTGAAGENPALNLHPGELLGPESASSALALHHERVIGSGQGARTGHRRQALLWLEPRAEAAHLLHPEALLGAESFSHAQSLEDDWVVGYGRGATTQGCDQALLWTEVGPTNVIPLHPTQLLGTDSISYATGISHRKLVGYGRGSETQRRVEALYWPTPEAEDAFSLHPEVLLGKQGSSWAVGISESWVVGYGRSPRTDHEYHALLWLNGSPESAINLHLAAPHGSKSSRAYGVSPAGLIVGCIDDQAALWVPEFL